MPGGCMFHFFFCYSLGIVLFALNHSRSNLFAWFWHERLLDCAFLSIAFLPWRSCLFTAKFLAVQKPWWWQSGRNSSRYSKDNTIINTQRSRQLLRRCIHRTQVEKFAYKNSEMCTNKKKYRNECRISKAPLVYPKVHQTIQRNKKFFAYSRMFRDRLHHVF